MATKRMKSDEVRRGWRDVLEYVRTGGTVIVEHYNRPVAAVVPCGEYTQVPEEAKVLQEAVNRLTSGASLEDVVSELAESGLPRPERT